MKHIDDKFSYVIQHYIMLSYILNFLFCQVLPDSEDEYEREYTDLSKLSNDLAEEYPNYKPENYSHTWNHLFNNK